MRGDGDEPGLTAYGPVTASHTTADAFHLQYRFYTYQLDHARRVDDEEQRQFSECVAGGGSTFNGAHQTRNGAGSTMEDADSRLIDRFDWGTRVDNAHVTASVGLGAVDPRVPITASIMFPLEGGAWTGGQAPYQQGEPFWGYLNDYATNLVHGLWKGDGPFGATGDYRECWGLS